jgi:hypothetical protein
MTGLETRKYPTVEMSARQQQTLAQNRKTYPAARSSFSAPRITILRASSRNGLCSAFALSHGARIKHRAPHRSSGSPASPSDWRDDRVRRRRQKAVDLMRSRDRLRLGPPVAVEGGPDAGEGEQRRLKLSAYAKPISSSSRLMRFMSPPLVNVLPATTLITGLRCVSLLQAFNNTNVANRAVP